MMPHGSSRSAHLRTLRKRLEFLQGKKHDLRVRADTTLPFVLGEIAALKWVLDQLDPEWEKKREQG